MHGLINKAIKSFLCDSFGDALWHDVALKSGVAAELGPDGFEAMQIYDGWMTDAMIAAAAAQLDRPRDSLLEDMGTYLISHERMEPLRRLLRFGGVSFTDFLYSLEDLRGRTQLAVAELAMPDLTLDEEGQGRFVLTCHACPAGFGHVMVGILRALADDYGALAVLEHRGCHRSGADTDRRARRDPDEVIAVDVYDPAFHSGRQFHLAATEAP
ncbi:MAG: heme NO-binding domain-containing protein [Pararhodobacter sp.]